MSTGSVVPIVVVGCGDIARTGHLPALARNSDVRLVGVVDPDRSAAEAVAHAYDTAVLGGVSEAASVGASAVIIATPPDVTASLTIAAIDRGLDVLCEKPMALRLDQAYKVARAADASDCVLQVGFKNRFSPLVGRAQHLISEGQLGRPIAALMGGLDEPFSVADEGGHQQKILRSLTLGNAFVHDGAHLADFMNYLLRSHPVSVAAEGLRTADELESENFVTAVVRYASGDVARLEIGWGFPSTAPDEFRLLGPEGVATVDREDGYLEVCSKAGIERFDMIEDWNVVCFDRQLDEFLRCVRSRVQPTPGVAEGLASIRLCLAVEESIRTGATVRLNE